MTQRAVATYSGGTIFFVFWLAWLCPGVRSADLDLPNRDKVFQTLRHEHPRLLATMDDFQQLQRVTQENEAASQHLARLKDEAEDLLTRPPVRYEIPDGKRLLAVSRRAKDRTLLLGLVYRLTGDRRFAQRLWLELDTVTRFRDWNPSHFLDTAEMTFAVAIGYDWLYDAWTDAQRQQLRQAVVELGLKPGLSVYHRNQWWSRAIHNWNQVCNGGLGVGAMAFAEDEPDIASEILVSALASLPLAMHEFRPDGGWGEGPGYWRYATEYNVYFLAALRTALGTDFGLSEMPGFSSTGDFPIYFTGPTGKTFNYADAHDGWHGAPQLFWLARAFSRPDYAAAQMPYFRARPAALDLLWGASWLTSPPEWEDHPTARCFQGVHVVTMRSGWNDPAALYVGFKGGDNRVNHSHLDLGTFVLDADGVRWALDLGPDDYNLPGYFGKQRWTYYRTSTRGHNTLIIDGQNQPASAAAPIVRFACAEDGASAVADLSEAYPAAERVQRGVAILDRRHMLVQDEVEASEPRDIVWQMHTGAQIDTNGPAATLTQDGHRLFVRILTPNDARFAVAAADTQPPERPSEGVRRLSITFPEPLTELRLAVLLTTDQAESHQPSIALEPLAMWRSQQDE